MPKKLTAFDVINAIFLILIAAVTAYPFINIISLSFSSYEAYIQNPMRIFPSDVTLAAYREIMQHTRLYSSYGNTIAVSLFGTILALLLYVLTAYPLSKKELKGRGIIMVFIIFTMMFSGGLIPSFYLIRQLKLYDTLTAVILVSVFSGFNLILVKNFFEQLPQSLIEAAKIDGASEWFILWKIVIPLSMPIISTIALFTAVGYWNNFFTSVVYIKSPQKWPLMLFLREIIMGARMREMASGGNLAEIQRSEVNQISIQYATLLLVILPIICVYPFLQKHFVKGVLVGSVKG